jgi:hypothetical protein
MLGEFSWGDGPGQAHFIGIFKSSRTLLMGDRPLQPGTRSHTGYSNLVGDVLNVAIMQLRQKSSKAAAMTDFRRQVFDAREAIAEW